MTGLDALGPPKGNPDGDILAQSVWNGEMMPEMRRRIWTVEGQQAESGTQLLGPVAGMGKGIIDANLQLMKGVRWLGSHVGMDFGMTDEQVPDNLYDLLPRDMKLRLASRLARSPEILGMNTRGASEFTGQVIPLLASGGTGLAGAVSGPGKAIEMLGAPGQALGRALGQIPKVAEWTRVAKALPPLLGSSTGFGLYNYITADGDMEDRVRAGAYGMLAGAALQVAGKAASVLESRLLDKTLTAAEGKAMAQMAANLRAGKLPSWDALSGMMKKAGARGASTLAEGTGFAFLNPEFTKALFDGDAEGAMSAYVEGLPAALLARTGRLDGWRSFRREAPETNTTELRRDIVARRRGEQEPRPQEPRPQQPSGEDVQMQAEPGVLEGARAQDPLTPVLDPLFQSGWDIPEAGVPKDLRGIEVEFPGQGKITITEKDGGNFVMEVPSEIFNTVRGMEAKTKTVRMEGAVAEEFARDLAAITMMRRMGGELQFGGREAWAGGPWVGEDGRLYSVGIDGQTYSKRLPVRSGDEWRLSKPKQIDVTGAPDTPSLGAWQALAQSLRRVSSPNPGLDLVEASVTTAINGSPESRSVQELRAFFDQVDPAQLSEMLTPQNLEPLGMLLGRIGSGHATAQSALMDLQQVMQPQEPAQAAGGREGEAGFLDIGAAADVAGRAMESAGDVATRGVDYMFETQAEVLRKANPAEPYSQEGRSILSRKRTIRGEVQSDWREGSQSARKLGKEWRNTMEDVGGGRGRIARWEQLADKRRKPKDDLEKSFVTAIQKALGDLYNSGRMAGMVRQRKVNGKTKWSPLPAKTSYVVQRIPGKHARDVYDDPALRKQWFDLLEDLNPGTSSAALEQKFRDSKGKDKKVTDSDVDTALEHVRELKVVPHELVVDGRTYEMRDSSLFDVMSRIIDQQSAQIATAERWGQDLPEGAREEVLKEIENEPATQQVQAVRRAMERQGVSARVETYKKSLSDVKLTPGQKDAAEATAEQWAVAIQGGAPIKLATSLRVIRNVTTAPRVFKTIKAPLWDVAEVIGQPLIYGAGIARTLKAMGRFWKNPADAVRIYERLGTVTHKMGDLIWEEASGVGKKIVDLFGWHADWMERAKGASFAVVADTIMESWDAGKPLSTDGDLLAELRFPPDQAARLLSGQADKELRDMFRNEYVQTLSSRTEKGEGPRWNDNPNLTAAFWFSRFAHKRAGSILRRVRDVQQAAAEHGDLSRQTRRKFKRLVMQIGMYGGTGMVGTFIIAFITGLIRLEGPKGAYDRAMREVPESTTDFVAKLAESAYRQSVGGPTAQVIEAGGDASNARKMAGLTTMTDVVYSFGSAVEAANRGDANFVMEALRNLGYIPLGADMKRALPKLEDDFAAMFSGENVSKRYEAIEDHDLALQFLATEGAKRGVLGLKKSQGQFNRTKSAGFYGAMGDAMAQFYRGMENGGFDEGWARALGSLERAMTEQGVDGDNLAGWIRSQRHTHNMDPDTVAAFATYVRDPERMKRIFAHDELLSDFARHVGRLKGDPDPEWSKHLDDYRTLIAMGGGDHNGMVDKAVQKAADSMILTKSADSLDMTWIDAISGPLATSPEGIRQVFSDKLAAALLREQDTSVRARYIRAKLFERAKGRTIKELKEAAQDGR